MRTILVVEDDLAVQRGIREFLEREGYKVVVERDGAAGLASARRGLPNLTILDVMLPSMNGFEVCARLKKSGYSAPIFILTGLSDEQSRLEGLGVGADDYIQKPFSIRELGLRVRNAFDRSERVFGKTRAIEQELLKAREIQLSSLPKDSPDVPGLEIFGMMRPATHVGGDYFDFVRPDEERIGVVVADVSGKGMPAAIYVHTMQGIVRASSKAAQGPSELLEQLQVHLGRSMEVSSFVTAVVAMFDLKTRTMEIANAGHLPVFLKRKGGIRKIHLHGFVIGQVADERFSSELQSFRIQLKAGDVVLFFTDGVVESFNEKGKEFGFGRLEREVITFRGTARHMVEQCFRSVDRFASEAPQSDDITVVAVKVLNERTGGHETNPDY